MLIIKTDDYKINHVFRETLNCIRVQDVGILPVYSPAFSVFQLNHRNIVPQSLKVNVFNRMKYEKRKGRHTAPDITFDLHSPTNNFSQNLKYSTTDPDKYLLFDCNLDCTTGELKLIWSIGPVEGHGLVVNYQYYVTPQKWRKITDTWQPSLG